MLSMLLVRKRSSVCVCVMTSEIQLSHHGQRDVLKSVFVLAGVLFVSENAMMMSMNVLRNWHLLVLGITVWGKSTSGGSNSETVVQSMLGKLKSPVIHMCLSVCMHERVVKIVQVIYISRRRSVESSKKKRLTVQDL